MKQRVEYSEKYRAGAMTIDSEYFPHCPHMANAARVVHAEIREAGRYADGTEYQVILVQVEVKP